MIRMQCNDYYYFYDHEENPECSFRHGKFLLDFEWNRRWLCVPIQSHWLEAHKNIWRTATAVSFNQSVEWAAALVSVSCCWISFLSSVFCTFLQSFNKCVVFAPQSLLVITQREVNSVKVRESVQGREKEGHHKFYEGIIGQGFHHICGRSSLCLL